MHFFIRMMSGDVNRIRVVNSEFTSSATAYVVHHAISDFIRTHSYKIIMFRNGEEISLFDEINSGELLDIFVKDVFKKSKKDN